MTSATPGATIHYTRDGTAPTASSTIYGAAISLPAGASATTTTLRAIALATGFEDSEVTSGTYVIGPPCTPKVYGSDLAVQWVSRLPRFPMSEVLYDPPGYNPHLSPASTAAKQWPDPGDTVTFVAHVANQGSAATPAVRYRFLVDGGLAGEGELASLDAGAAADAPLEWAWQDHDHLVRFELVGDGCVAFSDLHAANDAREQRTNAIMLTTYTWPGFEEWMAGHDNAVGTRSAADWIELEADEMNRLFALSASEVAPDGVELRIAIDRMVSVPEETPYGGGEVPPEPCPTDGCWAFGGPSQGLGDWLSAVDGQRDQVTMHEWGHQLGLLDIYQMDVQRDDVLVTEDPEVRTYSDSSARGSIEKLFDGVLTSPIVTYESRPVWFAVVFAAPAQVDEVRMRFDGYVHRWQVFSADTLEQATALGGEAVARGAQVTTTGASWGTVTFPPSSAKVWLVLVERVDGDQVTHVNEWEIYSAGTRIDVLALERASRVAGTPAMPVVAGDVIRYNSIGLGQDLMGGGIPYLLAPYTAWALNTDADWMGRGLPLRRGWFGRYLFDIPTRNTLVVQRAGAPLAHAQVEAFQQQEGTIPDLAKFTGTTDDAGRFVFPTHTTLEYAQAFGRSEPMEVANPFSTVFSDLPQVIGTNGVMLLRFTDAEGNRVYRFVDLLQFGLEYARGHVDDATIVVELP
jgi:hypothetical protein